MLLEDVAWEPSLLEPRRDPELERWVRAEIGVVPDFVGYLSACPWLVRAIVEGAPPSGRLRHLDLELAELVYLVVSHDNSCRYCYAAHRTILRVLGFSKGRIERMEQDLFGVESGASGRRILDFVRRFSRGNPLPQGADLAALGRDGLSREAALEVLFVAASAVLANRASTLPALPVEAAGGGAAGSIARLLGPLVGRFVQARARRRRLAAPQGDAMPGPFGRTLRAFAGLPAATVLRSALDGCWASPGLARATRALVFAVVARGLGAGSAEREALALAEVEGVGREAAEASLRHLEAPVADPVASHALSFARDTLWYEPARIQRRSRTLLAVLGAEGFLDLVGTTSLANAICRLSAVLDPL